MIDREGIMRLLMAFLLACTGPVARQALADEVAIEEWTVPYEESRPRDPYAASESEVWFVGQRSGYLARLDATTGEFTKVDLPPGSAPHNLIVAKNGDVWFAGNANAYIGRYDPRTGEIEKIAMPAEDARDPHTLVFDRDEKNIFFTVQGGNYIGRLELATRKVDLVVVETANARPYGIRIGPEGKVYVALFGTNKIAEVDPETLEYTEHRLQHPAARPRRLEVTSYGVVFYSDYARGVLGRLNPKTGHNIEFPLPGGEQSKPYGTAMDAEDRIWVVETGAQPNRLIGFDDDSEEFFSETPIPSGGGTVRHMHYHAPSNSIWFGTDSNTIGRAKLGE